MLIKYDSCHLYLERLYNRHASWARYSVAKVFIAKIESTQHVESIIGIIKKHVDCGTLLKELVTVIEQELEKEAQYTRIMDYYGSNLSVGLMLTYNTIFKEVDSILKDNLVPIPLSLQRAQIKQTLLYQVTLITIDQVKKWDINYNNIIEQLYDAPQIHLAKLITDIPFDTIKELWKVSYIAFASKPHYVVILNDSTLLCTCMKIISQGMLYRYQYRVLIQSNYTKFHISLIYTHWFESFSSNTTNFVTIFRGIKTKTSAQIAVSEGVTEELTGILMQFIMKYCHDTGLGIKDTSSLSSIMLQKLFTATKDTKSTFTITEVTESTSNLVLISSIIDQVT
ncbi:15141_t:CDS:2 [Gigaspora margarita]|uniref:15141_t:CDS:1 n=1 Tax=Gigaspora margarita TaxID=4874 RepID=A0ABN7UX69_GIGMA|nr:15141_t:CDS:2 [Gigaspora margarita]